MGRKPFQEATVLHVVAQLRDHSGPRRFLVADEVGLGKTLVAQGILQHLASGSHPFNVFYVCSSLTIASQNRDSLLEALPPADREKALVKVDRPTLLPWADRCNGHPPPQALPARRRQHDARARDRTGHNFDAVRQTGTPRNSRGCTGYAAGSANRPYYEDVEIAAFANLPPIKKEIDLGEIVLSGSIP